MTQLEKLEKLSEMIQEDLEGFAEAELEPSCELFIADGEEVWRCDGK